MLWQLSWRTDPKARKLADKHYNRQSIGAMNFCPPGRCLVLYCRTEGGEAFWVTSYPFAEYTKHAWAGAWVCSAFRNEGAALSSTLIKQAVAATKWKWETPALGMITFVDTQKVRKKRDWGRCYRKAGFQDAGFTKGGLLALKLEPGDMPEEQTPQGGNQDLFKWK